MKNHKYVDGRLLQTNKKFSALKVKQKEKIAHWVYDAYREQYKKTGRFPTKNDDSEIIDIVYQKIEMEGIWIPYSEVCDYYYRRKTKWNHKLTKEMNEATTK